MDDKLYFKITNADENHNGFQYVDGLNILDKPFQAEGSCVEGGLYFSDAEHILEFINYGVHLREITFPESDPDFKMVKDPQGDKWRANKIILGKKYNLSEVETFEYLFSLGAKYNFETYDYLYFTADDYFRWACRNGFLEIVKYWIKKGADITYKPAFQSACENGQTHIVKFFIESDTSYKTNGMISMASRHGHLEIVKLLIESGVDIKNDNKYALGIAAESNQLDIVKYLIEKGADCKAHKNYAIRFSCFNGHLDVVKYLIECGADIHCHEDFCLKWARANGHVKVVDLLKKSNFLSDASIKKIE